MIAYGDDKTERHLLFRFNQNVIASIEAGREFVECPSPHQPIPPRAVRRVR